MTPTQEVRIRRALKASNSVKKGAQVGTPVAIVSAYAAFRIAMKFAIPLEIASIAVGGIVQSATSLVSYFARGGRKGEAE